MFSNGLILEDAVLTEDRYIVPEVRNATIDLLHRLKGEFEGRAGFIFVLGYRPDLDRRFVSPLKHDYVGEAIESIDGDSCPDDRLAARIHYLTELAGGRVNVDTIVAHPCLSLLTHNDDDGAYLIDDEGIFLHNAYRLRPDPEDVLDEMGIPNHRTLGQRFGFRHNVGTRHTSAIATSYKLPHSEIYVLSQESGAIRGFHQGRIILSPYEEEVKR